MATKFVRIKPYDPQHGCCTKRYSVHGTCFDEAHGWYEVDDEDADFLRRARQRLGDPRSPCIFEICTESEARKIDDEEGAQVKTALPVDEARRVSLSGDDAPAKKIKRRRRLPKKRKISDEPSLPINEQTISEEPSGE